MRNERKEIEMKERHSGEGRERGERERERERERGVEERRDGRVVLEDRQTDREGDTKK